MAKLPDLKPDKPGIGLHNAFMFPQIEVDPSSTSVQRTAANKKAIDTLRRAHVLLEQFFTSGGGVVPASIDIARFVCFQIQRSSFFMGIPLRWPTVFHVLSDSLKSLETNLPALRANLFYEVDKVVFSTTTDTGLALIEVCPHIASPTGRCVEIAVHCIGKEMVDAARSAVNGIVDAINSRDDIRGLCGKLVYKFDDADFYATSTPSNKIDRQKIVMFTKIYHWISQNPKCESAKYKATLAGDLSVFDPVFDFTDNSIVIQTMGSQNVVPWPVDLEQVAEIPMPPTKRINPAWLPLVKAIVEYDESLASSQLSQPPAAQSATSTISSRFALYTNAPAVPTRGYGDPLIEYGIEEKDRAEIQQRMTEIFTKSFKEGEPLEVMFSREIPVVAPPDYTLAGSTMNHIEKLLLSFDLDAVVGVCIASKQSPDRSLSPEFWRHIKNDNETLDVDITPDLIRNELFEVKMRLATKRYNRNFKQFFMHQLAELPPTNDFKLIEIASRRMRDPELTTICKYLWVDRMYGAAVISAANYIKLRMKESDSGFYKYVSNALELCENIISFSLQYNENVDSAATCAVEMNYWFPRFYDSILAILRSAYVIASGNTPVFDAFPETNVFFDQLGDSPSNRISEQEEINKLIVGIQKLKLGQGLRVITHRNGLIVIDGHSTISSDDTYANIANNELIDIFIGTGNKGRYDPSFADKLSEQQQKMDLFDLISSEVQRLESLGSGDLLVTRQIRAVLVRRISIFQESFLKSSQARNVVSEVYAAGYELSTTGLSDEEKIKVKNIIAQFSIDVQVCVLSQNSKHLYWCSSGSGMPLLVRNIEVDSADADTDHLSNMELVHSRLVRDAHGHMDAKNTASHETSPSQSFVSPGIDIHTELDQLNSDIERLQAQLSGPPPLEVADKAAIEMKLSELKIMKTLIHNIIFSDITVQQDQEKAVKWLLQMLPELEKTLNADPDSASMLIARLVIARHIQSHIDSRKRSTQLASTNVSEKIAAAISAAEADALKLVREEKSINDEKNEGLNTIVRADPKITAALYIQFWAHGAPVYSLEPANISRLIVNVVSDPEYLSREWDKLKSLAPALKVPRERIGEYAQSLNKELSSVDRTRYLKLFNEKLDKSRDFGSSADPRTLRSVLQFFVPEFDLSTPRNAGFAIDALLSLDDKHKQLMSQDIAKIGQLRNKFDALSKRRQVIGARIVEIMSTRIEGVNGVSISLRDYINSMMSSLENVLFVSEIEKGRYVKSEGERALINAFKYMRSGADRSDDMQKYGKLFERLVAKQNKFARELFVREIDLKYDHRFHRDERSVVLFVVFVGDVQPALRPLPFGNNTRITAAFNETSSNPVYNIYTRLLLKYFSSGKTLPVLTVRSTAPFFVVEPTFGNNKQWLFDYNSNPSAFMNRNSDVFRVGELNWNDIDELQTQSRPLVPINRSLSAIPAHVAVKRALRQMVTQDEKIYIFKRTGTAESQTSTIVKFLREIQSSSYKIWRAESLDLSRNSITPVSYAREMAGKRPDIHLYTTNAVAIAIHREKNFKKPPAANPAQFIYPDLLVKDMRNFAVSFDYERKNFHVVGRTSGVHSIGDLWLKSPRRFAISEESVISRLYDFGLPWIEARIIAAEYRAASKDGPMIQNDILVSTTAGTVPFSGTLKALVFGNSAFNESRRLFSDFVDDVFEREQHFYMTHVNTTALKAVLDDWLSLVQISIPQEESTSVLGRFGSMLSSLVGARNPVMALQFRPVKLDEVLKGEFSRFVTRVMYQLYQANYVRLPIGGDRSDAIKLVETKLSQQFTSFHEVINALREINTKVQNDNLSKNKGAEKISRVQRIEDLLVRTSRSAFNDFYSGHSLENAKINITGADRIEERYRAPPNPAVSVRVVLIGDDNRAATFDEDVENRKTQLSSFIADLFSRLILIIASSENPLPVAEAVNTHYSHLFMDTPAEEK